MPEDRGSCVPNALLAQLSHLPPNVRAVHVRAGMVMYLIQNEDTVWVRNNVPILIYLNISEDKEMRCYSLDVIR